LRFSTASSTISQSGAVACTRGLPFKPDQRRGAEEPRPQPERAANLLDHFDLPVGLTTEAVVRVPSIGEWNDDHQSPAIGSQAVHDGLDQAVIGDWPLCVFIDGVADDPREHDDIELPAQIFTALQEVQ
jgi:hypothetical protein